MADCNETLRELEAFLDGEVPGEVHVAITRHLGQCPDCLEAFDFHAELKMVIAAKCAEQDMPAGLMSRIEACFQDDPGDAG